MIGRDRDVRDGSHRDAAELDGRTDVEPLHGLVEVRHDLKRLAVEAVRADPEEGCQQSDDGERR